MAAVLVMCAISMLFLLFPGLVLGLVPVLVLGLVLVPGLVPGLGLVAPRPALALFEAQV